RGYHGITVASASLTGIPTAHRDFDLPLPMMRHADCPDHYRHGRPGESEEAFATRMAESLDALIQREDPDTVAAFIAEPVMGAGGVIPPPRAYFEKVQAVLAKHDVLFIADEVILRLGPHGPDVRPRALRVSPGHRRDGEGALFRIPADLRHRDLGGAVSGASRRERQARRVRPRLHVLGAPRVLRRRAR